MPVIKRNQNSSEAPGRGLGPCGAGQARGRSMRGSGFNANRRGAGQGRELGKGRMAGAGRRNGSCRFMNNGRSSNDSYEASLEQRIANLEAENQRLRAESGK